MYKFNGKFLRKNIIKKADEYETLSHGVRSKIIHDLMITKQTLSNWERSKNAPRIEQIFWLKEFFGLDCIDCFFEKEKFNIEV